MASKNKPRSFTPKDGGALISRADWPLTGFPNYTVKLDFRRDYDQEMRREGNDWFHPSLDVAIGDQPFPQNQSFGVSGFSNGSFELDDNLDGTPNDWTVSVGAGITFSRDSATVSDGLRSAKFVSTTAGAGGYIETSAYLPATVGRNWRLRWSHLVTNSAFKVLVEVRWYDESLALLETVVAYSSVAGNPVTDFLAFERQLVVPVGAVFGKIRFYGKDSSDATTGSIWWDGVELVEREEFTKPIILLHQAKRPNGQMAVIAGTEDTIYRFVAEGEGEYFEDQAGGAYFEDDYLDDDYFVEDTDPNYIDDGYFTAGEGQWAVIGSGFDPNGRRWEAVNINGWAIFNNGSDLPQTFRVEEDVLQPNYEMRDAGIALVGTIAEYNGILIVGDVAIIKEDQIEAIFAHTASGGTALRQHGAFISTPFTVRAEDGGAVDLGASGSGSNVTFADDTDLEPSVDWTIEAVVKLGVPVTGSFYTIFGKSESYRLSVEAVGELYYLRLELWASSFRQVLSSAVPIAPSQWVHVAVVVDNNADENRFYINGEFVDLENADLSIPDSNANAAFSGAGSFTGPVNATGGMQIAELRFWQGKRTSDEIRDNFTGDVTGQTNLSAYWKLDEASGTSAADSTGNGNTGTLQTGAAFIASDAPTDSYIIVTPIAATAGGLTRVGTTATFIASAAHKLTTGQLVKIAGATDANYNGLFTVTVVDPLIFTYTVGGAPATPDPGSPTVQRALFGTATFNYDGMVGKEFFSLNGRSAIITAVVDPVKIKIEESIAGWTGDHLFLIRNNLTIPLTGTVSKNGTTTVAGVATLFTDELYPGASIMIPGGTLGDEIRVVAAIASATSLTVTDAFPSTAAGQSASQMSDFLLISDGDYFESTMVGRYIYCNDGSSRKITAFVDDRWATTDQFLAVSEQEFQLENVTAYGAIANASLYDRIQYRRAWSDIDQPLRWASSSPGSMMQGSRLLTLNYQRRSFEVGDEILVTGAGVAGGNLTATIEYIHPNRTMIVLDRAAETTISGELVARSDASGSISGFDDLQDDGSAIVKMMDLRGTLVTYKETAAFLSQYTGDVNAPFTAVKRYQGSKTPFYPDTLTNVDGRFHLYAGRTSYYSFDLVAQSPEEFDQLEACHDLFYSQATLLNKKLIFSFHNVLTKEVFFCFPSATVHKALCYDYNRTRLAPAGTVSTTGAHYTAGAWIKKPIGGLVIGITEDWVILGSPTGMVMRYGKADVPDAGFGGAKEIFNRLGAGYQSRLKGGLWGDRFHQTYITEWMAELSTQDYPTVADYTFNLYGYRNSAEAPRLVMTTPMPLPATGNLIPMLFLEHFFQDEIVVDGVNNPLRLAARTVVFSKTQSRGIGKTGLT